MNDTLDKTLTEKYPKLFVNRFAEPMESPMCWGFECGEGWFDLIDQLCHLIQGHIDWKNKRGEEVPQVVVEQVKEKFGGLRFYYDGGDQYINGLVSMAEAMSYNICEVCGDKGKVRHGGWIKTLCDTHDEERKKRLAAA